MSITAQTHKPANRGRSNESKEIHGIRIANRITVLLAALVFPASLLLAYWAIGIDEIDFFKQYEPGVMRMLVAACMAVFAYVCAAALFAFVLKKSNGVPRLVSPVHTLKSGRIGSFDALGVGKCSAALILVWLPMLLFLYPGIITFDGINQLYQYSTPAPTWYTTMQTFVDAEFIDHHPVFDTLLYGAFVYGFGGLFGSMNRGMFALVLFQTGITAISLSFAICYLEKLGLPRSFRLALLAFTAVFPLFPINCAMILKDTIHAPLFALFVVGYIEVLRSRGDALRSPDFALALIAISILCILTKKTGVYIVLPSLLIIVLCYRSMQSLVACIVPAIFCLLIVPLVAYPLLGGVAKGGTQEMLGVPLQQTTAVTLRAPNDITPEDHDAIDAVMDLDRAQGDFNPRLTDGAKNSFRAEASPADLARYVVTWLKLGISHPRTYVKTIVICSGSLYIPIEGFWFPIELGKNGYSVISESIAPAGQSFDASFSRSADRDTAIQQFRTWYRDVVLTFPPLFMVLAKGLYGGWIPLFLFISLLLVDRRKLGWLVPVYIAVIFLFVSPYDNARYVFPMLYSVAPMVGVLYAGMKRTENHDAAVRPTHE